MTDFIPLLSTVLLGLFAGSLLTEGAILVPYWRRMAPAEFFRLHSTLGRHLFRYFAPLTVISVLMSVVAALASGLQSLAWLITAGLCLATLAIFFIYFKRANQSFADQSLPEDDLGAELGRWAAWHWFRTGLIILAFGFSVYGH